MGIRGLAESVCEAVDNGSELWGCEMAEREMRLKLGCWVDKGMHQSGWMEALMLFRYMDRLHTQEAGSIQKGLAPWGKILLHVNQLHTDLTLHTKWLHAR